MTFDRQKMEEMNRVIRDIDHAAVFAYIEQYGLEEALEQRTGFPSVTALNDALMRGSTSGHRHDLPHPVAVLAIVAFDETPKESLTDAQRALRETARQVWIMNQDIVAHMSPSTLVAQGLYDPGGRRGDDASDAVTPAEWLLGMD